ncbi:MAG: hypothetical protein KGI37_00480 [Alphaproteobacteria bacterium]|nr:hypothetical protein [Alphaproteobacteria bacterium]
MKKALLFCGLAVALAACSDNGPAPQPPYNAVLPPKITMNVRDITLTDRSGMQPAGSPYDSNHFKPTITDAIKQWASDRLQAAGASGQASVIIRDASLTSAPLPVKDGMDSWFTRQQGLKYTAHAEVSVEANGAPGYADTDAEATRTVTLPENPTDIEKQNAYYTLLNGLMKDLGTNLEAGLRQHMGAFIVDAPQFGGDVMGRDMAPLSPAALSPASMSPPAAQSASLSGVAQENMQKPTSPVYGTTAFSTTPDNGGAAQ